MLMNLESCDWHRLHIYVPQLTTKEIHHEQTEAEMFGVGRKQQLRKFGIVTELPPQGNMYPTTMIFIYSNQLVHYTNTMIYS